MSTELRAPIRERIQVDGVRGPVVIRRWPGRGRPMVLIHGFMDTADGWDAYARLTHRPCIAINLPGFGRSGPLVGRPTVEGYAHAIEQVILQLELPSFLLTGHSLGGAIARCVADRGVVTPAGLTLICPAGFGRLHLAELAGIPGIRHLLAAALPLVTLNPFAVAMLYRTGVSGGKGVPWPTLRNVLTSTPHLPSGFEDALAALHRFSVQFGRGRHRDPSQYTGSVAALWGARDRLISPRHIDAVAQVYPHAHIDVWSELAHHPQAEQPERLHQFIERYAAHARRTRPHGRGRITHC